MNSGENKKGKILPWIALISFIIWTIYPLFLDIVGYEKEPEYYLIGLIPAGMMLLWAVSSIKVEDSASKNMRFGSILIFIGVIGMILCVYLSMSLGIPGITAFLEPLTLITMTSLIVILVGVCLFVYSFSQK